MGVGNVWLFFDWQAGRMTDDSVTIDDDTPPFPGRATAISADPEKVEIVRELFLPMARHGTADDWLYL